jgi:hypothetical protein
MTVWVSDAAALICAGLFGIGLGVGIVAGGRVAVLIDAAADRASHRAGEKRVIDRPPRPPLDGPE